ncbi:phosphate ABC transporter substrate-binding protein PstS [Noviherbaspirillum massiliense]|uniref:phosphate ABC transporter substrate-binding protein PstS n=1 Tax=Noviherbaspirillum massiliense TaxID=1465823 RepID=UPI0002EA68C9|nr:phosphate ABC transporter substrate-binding protein PstS [Noviherbaspirillum massiliense]
MPSTIKTAWLSLCLLLPLFSQAADVGGAGSSAAHPLYTKWAELYRQKNGISVEYQPVGSSAGIRQIKAKAVDFGASDVALGREELAKENLLCFPTAISGVVPVINLPGVKAGELLLSGEVLADIYAGKITKWSDAAIAALNPGIALPKLSIVIVARQDGSGTTYNLSDYLSKVSAAWKSGFGTGFTVKWPAGALQVKGSSGMVAAVRQTTGAIGYVDYNYVVQDKLVYPKLRNSHGRYVEPSPTAFASALANSGWKSKAAFEEALTDKPGPSSWPITMGTFVIVPRKTSNPKATIATLRFFTWAFLKGDDTVNGIDFVRLPDAVQARIYGEFTRITDQDGKPLGWSFM